MRGKRISIRLKTTLAIFVRDKTVSSGLRPLLLVIFTLTVFVTTTRAATEKVLHSFCSESICKDGLWPLYGGLTFDASGNLYGTTYDGGGAYNDGMAFELTPKAGGGWKEKVLHAFSGEDGNQPYGTLIFDTSGNLYGTTYYGGDYNEGTVFELTPEEGGGWKETVLHSFSDDGTDGYNPIAGMVIDASGNLYGTTYYGGTGGACSSVGCGMVFELTPKGNSGWTEKILHNFNNNGKDGFWPFAGLIFDVSGNLYGTTESGGARGFGTVFELTRPACGSWKEKVLHSFTGNDGYQPTGLIFDAFGNLYGTTKNGGAYVYYGTVFELTPKAGGGWTEKTLHSFNYNGKDGINPYAGLIFDGDGNLYGTTLGGGAQSVGTVFEVTPQVGGRWTEKILHNFSNNSRDGYEPYAGLIIDASGNLYGTTYYGGAQGAGTVFEVTP
jgi:uncharacterized repeat protein (TIGR03803 family)